MIDIDSFSDNRETNELIVEVFRLNGQLISTADKLVSKFGITGARWQVMGAIVRAGGQETVPRLANDIGLTRQSVQRVVNEMVDDRLLRFKENPQHKRSKLVTMSTKGEKVFIEAAKIQVPWVKALSEGISKKELAISKAVLNKLRQRLIFEAESGAG